MFWFGFVGWRFIGSGCDTCSYLGWFCLDSGSRKPQPGGITLPPLPTFPTVPGFPSIPVPPGGGGGGGEWGSEYPGHLLPLVEVRVDVLFLAKPSDVCSV